MTAALGVYIGDPSPRSAPHPVSGAELKRRRNKLAIAALLIDRGADVNRMAASGFSALHLAVLFSGNERAAIPIARQLIRRGARVDATLSSGLTPLHMAVSYQRPLMAHLLLTSGANPHIRDSRGDSAAAIAERKGMIDVVREMQKRSR